MTSWVARRCRLSPVIALAAPWVMMMAATPVAEGREPLDRTPRSGSTPVELSTSGCGSLAELNERIGRRSRRVRLAPASQPGRGLKVEISADHAGRREIVLTVLQESGQPVSRRMEAQTCDEAIEALALLIVLALDPAAANAPTPVKGPAPGRAERGEGGAPAVDGPAKPAQPPGPAAEETASPSPTPSRGAPAPPADREPAKDESPPEVTATRIAPRPEPAPGVQKSWRGLFAGGASGLVIVGPTPQAMAGGSLYAVWGWDRGSPWSPAIALAVAHAQRDGTFPGGTASFELNTLQLELCPVWMGMHRRFGGRACALGAAGALVAQGTQTLAPEVHQRAFALLGGSAALIYEPGWRVMFMASGVLGFPLQRYAFAFDPSVFYRVAAVSVTGSLGVGVRFY